MHRSHGRLSYKTSRRYGRKKTQIMCYLAALQTSTNFCSTNDTSQSTTTLYRVLHTFDWLQKYRIGKVNLQYDMSIVQPSSSYLIQPDSAKNMCPSTIACLLEGSCCIWTQSTLHSGGWGQLTTSTQPLTFRYIGNTITFLKIHKTIKEQIDKICT